MFSYPNSNKSGKNCLKYTAKYVEYINVLMCLNM